jgi:hypothetical protein
MRLPQRFCRAEHMFGWSLNTTSAADQVTAHHWPDHDPNIPRGQVVAIVNNVEWYSNPRHGGVRHLLAIITPTGVGVIFFRQRRQHLRFPRRSRRFFLVDVHVVA